MSKDTGPDPDPESEQKKLPDAGLFLVFQEFLGQACKQHLLQTRKN
jgi:hypothetical protein